MFNKKILFLIICLWFIFSNLFAPNGTAAQKIQPAKKDKATIAPGGTAAKITGVNISDGEEKLSILILTDKEVKRNSYRMANPYRICMDIYPAELSINKKLIEINKGGIKKISFQKLPKNVIKVIIELNKLVGYDISVKENTTVVNIAKEKGSASEVKAEVEVKVSTIPLRDPRPSAEKIEPQQKIEQKQVVKPIVKIVEKPKAEGLVKKEVSKRKSETKVTSPVSEGTEETASTIPSAEKKEKTIKKKLKRGSLDQLVTLELVNADLLATLRAIVDDIGYNLIASKSVSGIITLTLRDVPLRRALDAMLNMNGFSYIVEGNIIEIGTSAELTSEDEQGKLITQSFSLNFAKAETIQVPLKAVLSKNGSIQIDARTNTLIVTDTMPKLRQAAAMIERLDTSIKQVMIEAKLIEVSTTKENELGIKWLATKGDVGATFPTSKYPEIDAGAQSNSPAVSAGFAGILQIGTIAGSHKIGLILNALATSTDANILANPRVTTLDNKTARINITTEFPYLSSFSKETGIASYSSVSTGITLEVTPQVNPSGFITMKVKPTVSSVVSPGPPPVVDRRETETEVLVKDGDTLVIGGLLKEDEITKISKVPFLGDIPLIGFLFKDKYTQKTKKDLIIFITPHIL